MSARVGVLALQGASAEHLASLKALGVQAIEVRSRACLDSLTHLVIPGGESTTIRHLMNLFGLWEHVQERHRNGRLALFGTCAGAILLGREAGPSGPRRPSGMNLLDIEVRRNAYGRQIDSFTRAVRLEDGRELRGVFIRAPRIESVGAGVDVIARDGDEPVAVRAPGLMACTFHPELSGSHELHRRFLADVDWQTSVANRAGAVTP